MNIMQRYYYNKLNPAIVSSYPPNLSTDQFRYCKFVLHASC